MVKAKDKYKGQALAIVLIIIVVAAIIAMAIISRVKSEQRNVADSRSSTQSLNVSDDIIESMISLPIKDIANLVNDPLDPLLRNMCRSDNADNYDFWENGCVLDDTEETIQFLNEMDSVLNNPESVFSVVASQIEAELTASCGKVQHEVKMTILPIEEGEKIVLQEGVVLSLIPDSVPEAPSTPVEGSVSEAQCNINISAKRVREGSKAGLIESAVYFNSTRGFAEYDSSYIKGYCLFNCIGDLSWIGTDHANGWVNSPDGANFSRTYAVTQGTDVYGLNELRLRSIGDNIKISYTTTPTSCVELKQIMKLRVTTSCSGTSQGKEVIIPRDNWTPAVFDYTIYNGQGTLEYSL